MSTRAERLEMLSQLADIVKQRDLSNYAEQLAKLNATQDALDSLAENLINARSRLSEAFHPDTAALGGADEKWERFVEIKQAQLAARRKIEDEECAKAQAAARRSAGRSDVLKKLAGRGV